MLLTLLVGYPSTNEHEWCIGKSAAGFGRGAIPVQEQKVGDRFPSFQRKTSALALLAEFCVRTGYLEKQSVRHCRTQAAYSEPGRHHVKCQIWSAWSADSRLVKMLNKIPIIVNLWADGIRRSLRFATTRAPTLLLVLTNHSSQWSESTIPVKFTDKEKDLLTQVPSAVMFETGCLVKMYSFLAGGAAAASQGSNPLNRSPPSRLRKKCQFHQSRNQSQNGVRTDSWGGIL